MLSALTTLWSSVCVVSIAYGCLLLRKVQYQQCEGVSLPSEQPSQYKCRGGEMVNDADLDNKGETTLWAASCYQSVNFVIINAEL